MLIAVINPDQRFLVPPFQKPQDNFLYWLAQVKALLKTKHIWYVLWGEDAASIIASPQGRTEQTVITAEGVIDNEYVWDVSCSLILQILGGALFARVMAHERGLRRIWEFQNQRYSTNTAFSKVALYSTSAWTRYAGQEIREYDDIVRGFIVTMLVESFGNLSRSLFGTALSALLTRADHIR